MGQFFLRCTVDRDIVITLSRAVLLEQEVVETRVTKSTTNSDARERSMSWNLALRQLDSTGIVEFGIHQMNEKTGSPKWRRHKGGPRFRFQSVRSSLFSISKGARAACLGKSSYARTRYSAGPTSVVPYVATWLQGSELAFLVRAGAIEPEVTLVPVLAIAAVDDKDHAHLLALLASLFGEGAKLYGVHHLASDAVQVA